MADEMKYVVEVIVLLLFLLLLYRSGVVQGFFAFFNKRKDNFSQGERGLSDSSYQNQDPYVQATWEEGRAKQAWDSLNQERYGLEQQVARLVGGGTGMVALRDHIESLQEGDGRVSVYRDSYWKKQQELRGILQRYCEIIKEMDGLPEGVKEPFHPLTEDVLYQELLAKK